MMELSELRTRLDAFSTELTRETYLATAGLKEEANIEAIYDRFADLFSPESLAAAGEKAGLPALPARFAAGGREQAGEVPDEIEARRMTYLREFLALGALDYSARELKERVFNEEAAAQVDHPEGKIAFRQSFVKIRNEEARATREKLSQGQQGVIAGLQPLLARQEELLQEESVALGFPSYITLVRETSGLDLEALRVQGEGFLADTQEIYRENLAWFLKKCLRLKVDQAKKHDLEFLLRGMEYDSYFPGGDLLPSVEKLLGMMGLELTAGGRIRCDLESRPLKAARAFCAPVKVPEEVYLIIAPAGGYKIYEDFLHELGHALHYAYVHPDLEVEFKRLGDYSVTEGYAFLFDHILLDGPGLAKGFRIPEAKDLLRFLNLGVLYLVRRYFAKLTYELELHADQPLTQMEELYQETLTAATLVEYPATNYLYDLDPHFYCARYLMAWMLEAVLHGYLRDHYDEDWFRCPEAGGWLQKLFSVGQKWRAEELASRLGLALTPEKLKARTCEYLE